MNAQSIPQKVKQARENAGLTQRELGRRTGLSNSHISMIEKGERVPTLDALSLIAAAMGLELIVDFAGEVL